MNSAGHLYHPASALPPARFTQRWAILATLAAVLVLAAIMGLKLGALSWVASSLSDRAALAVGEWDARTVALVWNAAHGFLDRVGSPLEPEIHEEQREMLEPVRRELGQEQWEAVARGGRAMSLEAGVDLARAAIARTRPGAR